MELTELFGFIKIVAKMGILAFTVLSVFWVTYVKLGTFVERKKYKHNKYIA